MSRTLITIAGTAGLLALASCGEQTSDPPSGAPATGLTEPPPRPSPEVVEALGKQPFASKLLGRTHYLVGDSYAGADLQKAPEYYLLNFSGSF